jgi:GTP-binding protein
MNKVSVDIGLLGYPDAGKSSLFNALTGSAPSMRMPRYAEIAGTGGKILADIGGLWRSGGPENPGFLWLKYIEGAGLLIFVVNLKERRFEDAFLHLLQMVTAYSPAYQNKRRLIAANRDCSDAMERFIIVKKRLARETVLPFSPFTGEGITEIADFIGV